MNVLCVTDYFLPGFKGGGPIRTLENMRKQVAGQVILSIFTRDRDLGSDTPYDGIESDRWVETPDGPIYYASPGAFGPRGLRQALAARHVDLVYLNSYFSLRSSILLYLTLRWIVPEMPILLAPRGEFSPGALAVKRPKKWIFLTLARIFGLYRDVFWHASTPLEAGDILRQFPKAEGRIHIAPDPVLAESVSGVASATAKEPERLRLAFISRISPKKNLDGLLGLLANVGVPVRLDIFGPVEDGPYWRQCEVMIARLPGNIQVTYRGPLTPDEVSGTFARYDLFAFPTHGENFGHVIFEALRAGTPVIISDQTSWPPDEAGAVTVIPLQDTVGWSRAIEQAAKRSPGDYERLRAATLDYVTAYMAEEKSLKANLEMFSALVV